jgi:hypothetical protein
MKKQLNKMALWQSFLSVTVLGVFIFLAVGSIEVLNQFAGIRVIKINRGNGVFEESEVHSGGESRMTTGGCDQYDRWQGPVRSAWFDKKGNHKYTEEVMMVNGLRDGVSKYTWWDGRQTTKTYDKGKFLFSYKNINSSYDNKSAFDILTIKYPWFLYTLNVFDFSDKYIKAYTDTLEKILGSYVFEAKEFDNYYEDAWKELEKTPFDSIININSDLTLMRGIKSMKNSEFRLATIDRCRSAGSTTFNIISTTYPGYLLKINSKGVNNADFNKFCHKMDSCMNTYGTLNQQDPFFVDSVDARMFRAINTISSSGKSLFLSGKLSASIVNLLYESEGQMVVYIEGKSILNQPYSKSSPKEVSSVVVMNMLEEYYVPEEIFRQAVMEAYYIKKGIKRLPSVTTGFVSNNSPTSVTLQGNVIEDGDAVVTSRGIAWTTFYNPTTNDNKAAPGIGSGSFSATITGLTAGTTYYARTYATNSAGTAYGNCISFGAGITTGINDTEKTFGDFTIHPNPVSDLATLRFHLESSSEMKLIITDMNGRELLHRKLNNIPVGDTQIEMNFGGFQNGIYNCLLTNGKTRVSQKFVIAH